MWSMHLLHTLLAVPDWAQFLFFNFLTDHYGSSWLLSRRKLLAPSRDSARLHCSCLDGALSLLTMRRRHCCSLRPYPAHHSPNEMESRMEFLIRCCSHAAMDIPGYEWPAWAFFVATKLLEALITAKVGPPPPPPPRFTKPIFCAFSKGKADLPISGLGPFFLHNFSSKIWQQG